MKKLITVEAWRRLLKKNISSMAPWLIALSLCSVASAQTSNVRLFDEVWQTVNDAYYDPTFGGLNWNAVRGGAID